MAAPGCSKEMGDKLDTCPTCHGPLIEIDRYRERLVGCIESTVGAGLGVKAFPWRCRRRISRH
jgi:hypothetical protein